MSTYIQKINWKVTEYMYLDKIFFPDIFTEVPLELSSGTNLLKPSEIILNSINAASYDDYNYYSSPLGNNEIRNSILKFEEQYFNKEFPKNIRASLTSGAADALRLTFQYLYGIGKRKVLVLGLQYPIIFQNITNAGIQYHQLITNNIHQGYLPTIQEILAHYSECKFDTLFLTQPNNPAGSIYTELEFNKIVKFAKGNNIFIVYEKIGSDLPFDIMSGERINHSSLVDSNYLSYIIIDSFSKKRAISGLRLGYIVAGKDFIEFINYNRFGDCPTLIGQNGLEEDIKITTEIVKINGEYSSSQNHAQKKQIKYLENMYGIYKKNLHYFKKKMKDFILNVSPYNGGFNVVVELNIHCDEIKFALDLFNETKIIIYPIGCFEVRDMVEIEKRNLQFRLSLAEDSKNFKPKVNQFRRFINQYAS